MSLDEASDRLAKHLGRRPEFPADAVIENEGWWFIPCVWIGTLGFVVDKGSGEVFQLGSGLGHLWQALEAFQRGLVPPSTPKAD